MQYKYNCNDTMKTFLKKGITHCCEIILIFDLKSNKNNNKISCKAKTFLIILHWLANFVYNSFTRWYLLATRIDVPT